MAGIFEREGMTPTNLSEPYASLLAFLSDLDEQVDLIAQAHRGDPFCDPLFANLKQSLAGLGLIVMLQARVRPNGEPKPDAD